MAPTFHAVAASGTSAQTAYEWLGSQKDCGEQPCKDVQQTLAAQGNQCGSYSKRPQMSCSGWGAWGITACFMPCKKKWPVQVPDAGVEFLNTGNRSYHTTPFTEQVVGGAAAGAEIPWPLLCSVKAEAEATTKVVFTHGKTPQQQPCSVKTETEATTKIVSAISGTETEVTTKMVSAIPDKFQPPQPHGVKAGIEATVARGQSGQSKSATGPLQPEANEVEPVEQQVNMTPPIKKCTTMTPRVQHSDYQTVAGVGIVLARMASAATKHQSNTYFNSDHHRWISLREYLKRLRRSLECSDECYVIGLIYIDRLLGRHPEIGISLQSCHNLLLTSVVLAAKFHDEACRKNEFYADAGSTTVAELNAMEWRFVELLNWKLKIRPSEYNIYRETLRHECEEVPARARTK